MLLLRGSLINRIKRSCIFIHGRQKSKRSKSSGLYEVGHVSYNDDATRFEPGQFFLNRTYGYRGIIVASFDCKEFRRKISDHYSLVSHYQVLIHRDDWKFLRFPVDYTTYLADTKEGRVLSVVHGMDSVRHSDILPIDIVPSSSGEFRPPIEHDLFKTLFRLADYNHPGILSLKAALMDLELGFIPIRSWTKTAQWMRPQMTHFEETAHVVVSITTFYLGHSNVTGQSKFYWRYIIRIRNYTEEDLVLRERHLKIFSLNNLTQITATGVPNDHPLLSLKSPAYQFGSTIELSQKKGGHMWGKLVVQRLDGSTFEVNVPTIVLESTVEKQTSNVGGNAIN